MGTPNLFILGAAKSGTTSLWTLLGKHPDIQASHPKEPSFFCSYFQDTSNPVEYFSLFDNSKKYRLDSSHVYLTNPESSIVISDLFPAAKFIVILRKPELRSYSLYRHMRRFRHADGEPYELINDFYQALVLEDERFVSDDFFKNCRQYFWNFMYCRSSMFDEQLSRYFQYYGWKNFFITTLGEFSRDPLNLMKSISDFLEIDAGPLQTQDGWHFNRDPQSTFMPSDAGEYLRSRFAGLTERVDGLIGRKLDWSL